VEFLRSGPPCQGYSRLGSTRSVLNYLHNKKTLIGLFVQVSQKSLKAHMQRIHWQMLTQKIFSIVKNNQFQNLQWVKWQNTQLLVKRSANPFHKCIFVKRKIKNIRIFCLRAWKEEGLSNLFLNIFEIFFGPPF